MTPEPAAVRCAFELVAVVEQPVGDFGQTVHQAHVSMVVENAKRGPLYRVREAARVGDVDPVGAGNSIGCVIWCFA
jgi:hypothetical protein